MIFWSIFGRFLLIIDSFIWSIWFIGFSQPFQVSHQTAQVRNYPARLFRCLQEIADHPEQMCGHFWVPMRASYVLSYEIELKVADGCAKLMRDYCSLDHPLQPDFSN